MTNAELFQLFTSESKCPNHFGHSSLLVMGPVLYSYGTHFAVAFRVPSAYNESSFVRPLFLMNTEKRSVTTSKHQSQFRAIAIKNFGPDCVIDFPRLTEFVNRHPMRYRDKFTETKNENRETFLQAIRDHLGAESQAVISRFN